MSPPRFTLITGAPDFTPHRLNATPKKYLYVRSSILRKNIRPQKLISTVLVFVGLILPVHADRSVFQDDVLAGRQKWRADFGLTYTSISTPPVVVQQLGPGEDPQTLQTRSDIVSTTVGVRYGLSHDIEIGFGAAFETGREGLVADGLYVDQSQWQGPSFIVVGASYQAVRDQRLPGVVLFVDTKILDWTSWASEDQTSKHRSQFKSFGFGGMLYHRIDPVVLFISASHAIERERIVSGRSIDPPDAIQIQPGFNFAINQDITASFNASWSQSKDWVADQERRGARFSSVRLNTGLRFQLHHKLSTGFTAGLNTTGTTYPILGFASQIDL